MQMLYAVEFDVMATESEDPLGAYEILMEHLHGWLAWGASACPSIADLKKDGEAEYLKVSVEGKTESSRKASWKLAGATGGVERSFRIDVRQPLLAEGTWFQTRITVSHDENQARLRVVMGRDITTGWLSPVPFEILRRPRLILDVTRNSKLHVRVLGQYVDDRYVPIRTREELGPLVDAVKNLTRLPILVVGSNSNSAREFAYRAAQELQGLARVATLSPFLCQEFNKGFLDDQVPYGGARLYWPDRSLRQPYFSAEEISRNGIEYAVQQIMRLLAPISVIARGRDIGWDAAVAAERLDRAGKSKKRLNEARALGDQLEEIRVLTEAYEQKQNELTEMEGLNNDLLVEKDQLRGQLQMMEDYRYQLESWKSEYFKLVREGKGVAARDWSEAPDCANDNIEDLLVFIKEVSGGSFEYTENSVKSWHKSQYPYPAAMRDALIDLARASVGYRESGGHLGQRLEDWIGEKYPLRVAMSDKGLTRSGLDKFEFEGRFHSRIPHVKLDDNTSPDRVGRIYFGVDSEEFRFIVDHIGLKLYGL
ncbi:hypothetical protein GCM10027598_72550 [Amycolatopsis oliviviridis]|uniref:Uncharacterized protein n=1 Tax=Amycolatopsis oliviviridis TaxID=1471590 RepID=A0ABQ3L453_9PSEU|nr:hypothetical protein [Amycolatopsis oliviviridis]GHH01918.1 hypothetical protein GCM10017790_02480 [Amycolatopsis oliviviridis]